VLRCNPGATSDHLAWFDECRLLRWDRIAPAFTRATASCFPTLSCTSSDDACSAMGYGTAGVTEQSVAANALVQTCLINLAGCGVGDDVCIDLSVLTDSAR
jgi:hypothetical protein